MSKTTHSPHPAGNATPRADSAPPDAALSDPALDAALDRLARAPAPPLPDDLSARLMADALAAMPPAMAPSPWPRVDEGIRWRDRLLDWLAGAPGMAGAAAAGLVGLWIGLAAPGPAEALGLSLQATLWSADGAGADIAGLLADDALLWALNGAAAEAGQ